MKRVTKLFQTKATSIDEETKTVRFKISDNQPDRMGERVDQKSWDFKSYLKNPIVLWGHNPDEPENVLGTATSLEISADGNESYAELQFDSDINPKADLVFEQVKRGTLRTVSVGFINHTFEIEDDDPVLKDNELLEISIVPIPANPRAVALALKEGAISRKDATWLMQSMRKEADLIEKQIQLPEPNKKEKSMTDEQAQALLDGMTKLTEKVDSLATENATLKDEIASLKPVEETPEQKAEREAKEAADAEAARKAAAEEETKPPAKSGDDDQDGAGEDDFDPEAEVTPEQQAEIDAAIDAELAAAT